MRGAVILAVLGHMMVLCYAVSEPYDPDELVSSGSGDDVVIINPTKNSPPTDANDDLGSGTDDEDGDAEASGTTALPSITRATTAKETTTQEATTTQETATTASIIYINTSTTKRIGDDEDDAEVSGSGSGSGTAEPIVISPSPKETTTETSTDIYLTTKPTSTDNAVYIPDRTTAKPTDKNFKKVTTKAASITSSKGPTTSSKRTTARKPATEATAKTLVTTKVPTKAATTRKNNVDVKTHAPSVSTGRPRVHSVDPKDESTDETNVVINSEQPSEIPRSKSPNVPTKRKTTKAVEPDIMARHGKKDEGFTLTTEIIVGVVGCALLALLLIAFLMYRLKKRDEGSYLLDESNGYPEDFKKVSDKEAFI